MNRATPTDRRPPFVRFTHAFGRTLVGLLATKELVGLDRPDLPRSGPVIITSNHLSSGDPALIGSYLSPALGRQLHWLGKEELLSMPLLGWAMAQNGVIGIRRGSADVDAYRTARRILDEGLVLVVFPEGTRSRTGGLHAGKDGVATLAWRTGATILPVGLEGTDRWWPRGSAFPHPGGRLAMRVGAPYRLPEPTDRPRREAQRDATETIMRRIAALLSPAYRGVYGDQPTGPTGVVSAPDVT